MESGRLFFDTSACHGNMLFLGNSDSIFRGNSLSKFRGYVVVIMVNITFLVCDFEGGRTMMNLGMDETTKRRPFFSSAADMYEEEYYDDQLPEKKRRLTPEQVSYLFNNS